MKRMLLAAIMIMSLAILGCSTPSVVKYGEIYSYTKIEQKKKSSFGNKEKIIIIKDFRTNDAYYEDIDALKEKVEKYISGHPGITDIVKNDLRALKVTVGLTKEEVELLLGKPDRIAAASLSNQYKAQGIWIYKINKMRAYSVFIVPVFLLNETYYLYFTADNLAGIEKHTLKQTVKESPGPGVYGSSSKIGGMGSSSSSDTTSK